MWILRLIFCVTISTVASRATAPPESAPSPALALSPKSGEQPPPHSPPAHAAQQVSTSANATGSPPPHSPPAHAAQQVSTSANATGSSPSHLLTDTWGFLQQASASVGDAVHQILALKNSLESTEKTVRSGSRAVRDEGAALYKENEAMKAERDRLEQEKRQLESYARYAEHDMERERLAKEKLAQEKQRANEGLKAAMVGQKVHAQQAATTHSGLEKVQARHVAVRAQQKAVVETLMEKRNSVAKDLDRLEQQFREEQTIATEARRKRDAQLSAIIGQNQKRAQKLEAIEIQVRAVQQQNAALRRLQQKEAAIAEQTNLLRAHQSICQVKVVEQQIQQYRADGAALEDQYRHCQNMSGDNQLLQTKLANCRR